MLHLGFCKNHYGNTPVVREAGLETWPYTRAGATESTSIVDLWALNGTYTHGSVRKPGNDQAHGYDWESKPGSLSRTFHPRHALRGFNPLDYGDVYKYYVRAGGAAAASEPMPDQSVLSRLNFIERPTLTTAETAKIDMLKSAMLLGTLQTYRSLYSAWKDTWSQPELAVQSNPRRFTESKEYADLLQFCQKAGRSSWPLAFESFANDASPASMLLEDLTIPDTQALFEQIREEAKQSKYTADGRFIVPTPHSIVMKYIKALLADMS